jgi:outer membrane protein TolC
VRDLKTDIAKKQVAIQYETVKSIWSEVYLDVRGVYTKIILDKKKLELARTNLDILRQFYAKVQVRYQAGDALKNDLQRAKIEVLGAENSYLAVENELTTGKAKLNLLLGREFDVPFEAEEELTEEDVELNLNEITSTALSNRPDLKAEELALDAKAKTVAKEQLNRLPSPFVGFKRTTEDYDNDSAVVVGMSLPLWNLNQGEVKKAKAQKEAQTVRVAAAKRGVMLGAYEAYLNTELAKKQLGLLKQSLEEANELLRLADLHYSEGKVDFINYLDQVRTVNETRVRYYQGLFELNSAVNELEKSVYASFRKEDFLK